MTPFLALAGFYAMLHVPVLGPLVSHGILHALVHFWDHHAWFPLVFACLFWALLLSLPASLFLGNLFVSGDLLLLLLITWKLFSHH